MKYSLLFLLIFTILGCGKKEETENKLLLEVEKQKQTIDSQNQRILLQEKIENERKQQLIKDSINLRIEVLSTNLYESYDKLEKAKKNLNDVTAFKLLRSSSERNKQINSAQIEIDVIKSQIEDIESELDQLQPNWRDTNK